MQSIVSARAALVGASILATALSLPGVVAAQGLTAPPPPLQLQDPLGVDIISGQASVSSPTISVGDPAHGGLSFTAMWDGRIRGWRYSSWGEIKRELVKPDTMCEALYHVTYMGSAKVFQRAGCGLSTFRALDGDGTLVETSSGYQYTAIDGSVATYVGAVSKASISQIVRPSGEVITFGATSVSNNYGYQLHFDYVNGVLTKVTALNNAVDACGLSATTCTYSQTWPSLTFSGSSVTDNLGRSTQFSFDGQMMITSIVSPTGITTNYTNDFVPCGGYRVIAAQRGTLSQTYTYDVNKPNYGTGCEVPDPDNLHTTITNAAGGARTYEIAMEGVLYYANEQPSLYSTPTIVGFVDELNQNWTVGISSLGPSGGTLPEGNSISITRNFVGQITEIRQTAKPGTNIPDVVSSATFPECDVEPVKCHFPSQMVDARGGVTDYTYDAAGNLLTVTGPAPTPGAARPRTVYTWEQRYAWYKQNGSSAISQASSPVWVMTSQYSCMTGATC